MIFWDKALNASRALGCDEREIYVLRERGVGGGVSSQHPGKLEGQTPNSQTPKPSVIPSPEKVKSTNIHQSVSLEN